MRYSRRSRNVETHAPAVLSYYHDIFMLRNLCRLHGQIKGQKSLAVAEKPRDASYYSQMSLCIKATKIATLMSQMYTLPSNKKSFLFVF